MKPKITDLERVAKSATTGEWTAFEAGPWGGEGYGVAITNDIQEWFCTKPETKSDTASSNATHIAAFNPQTALALIEALKTARAALEVSALGSVQWDGVEAMHAARKALAALDEQFDWTEP